MTTDLIEKTKQASKIWQEGFNTGNAEQCAGQYTSDAIMYARPFGEFKGTEAIQSFWRQLIEDGFADVTYINPTFSEHGENTVELKSQWKMNKAGGVIHSEIWELQADGSMKLVHDDFEAIAPDA